MSKARRAPLRSGTVVYTERAFHQDATDAMRGDIVRGLIEAITNADDAYGPRDARRRAKKITVEVEHRRLEPWIVRVRDRAGGIPDLVNRITRIGDRTSGFEGGEARRGNLGRGAKDLAAFGNVRFSTIHEGRCSVLILKEDGAWDLVRDHDATSDDREELGIRRGSGTVVELRVRPNVRCPQHDTIRRRLSSHYELRDILSSPARKVELVNLNNGVTDPLTYTYPRSETAVEIDLEIEDCPDASAHLRISRLPERCDDGPDDPGRVNGILVKGERAVYEATLFSYEGNIHAGFFEGEVRCPYIDDLVRAYDDRLASGEQPDQLNPVPLISRQRDGLRKVHPFYMALQASVEAHLGELVHLEAERARLAAGSLESDKTRAVLNRVARELGRLVADELKDIEAEELPPPGPGQEPPLLEVVPEQCYAYLGEDRTLTVAARREGLAAGDEIEIEVDPAGVVEVLSRVVPLHDHRRRDDIFVGQIRLRPLIPDEATLVTARVDGRVAHGLVEVKQDREVVTPEVIPPEGFEFERSHYSVGWQKTKRLLLRAPIDDVLTGGNLVHLSSSKPGVVLRDQVAELVLDEELGFFQGIATVEARRLGSKATLIARMGDLTVTTRVSVTRKEDSPSILIRLVDDDFGPFRGVLDIEPQDDGSEIQVLKIATQHKALRPYFGSDGQGQDTAMCRSIMAEVMVDTVARHVVSELYEMRRGSEDFDPARVYREHYRRLMKFLPPIQRLLVGEPSRIWDADQLEPSQLLTTSS